MKPDGRSLDIAVIGLGQAGGNLAAEFHRRGYRAMAFNTAQTDLSALDPGGMFPALPAERRHYVGLDGYDGAGADPEYGRQCISEHADQIRKTVLKMCHDADAVLVTAGLGGGTGSSVAELLSVLESEELPIMALMTLPSETESGIAKVNAVRAINDVVNAPLLGWVFVDNGRIAKLNKDVSIVDYYAHINAQIAAPLDALNRLNDRDKLHPIRSFDGEDYRKLLLSGGVLNYSVTHLPEISTDEVVGAIRDSIETSDLMPSGFDPKRLSYMGYIIEAPEMALSEASIETFAGIEQQLKDETEGAAVYQGLYRAEESHPITLRLIAATQSLPTRIRELLGDAKKEGIRLGEKIREELPSLELGEIADVELFRRPGNLSRRPGKSKRPARPALDLGEMSMEVGRRAPRERPPAPEPQPAKPVRMVEHRRRRSRTPPPSPSRPSGLKDLGTEEIDVVAQLAQLGDLDLEELNETRPAVSRRDVTAKRKPAELPSAEDYDALVSRYLSSNDAQDRATIAQRLEGDSRSEHTVVRYYAVEAMSKVGRRIFGHALLTAAEDENEAVRSLAAEALKA